MTLALTDVLLAIIAIATVAGAIAVIRIAGQVMRTAAEVERVARHLNYLEPRFERLLEEAESELVQARELTGKINSIAVDFEMVAEQTRKTLMPALHGISAITGPLQYIGAAVTGAKIGMKVLGKKHQKADREE